ncbi:hypothetical protein SAMN05428983_0870 [Agrobacterium fabrum]|uniref:Uncharacterized protein n=1 Tax=Agrobacterium fabrum TaxID=1176649 RepID=A0A7Z7FNV7_9HYPH|nr:hypothetical protein SAMN05428983_0870 [Agrobacterium fabrum]
MIHPLLLPVALPAVLLAGLQFGQLIAPLFL